MDYIDLYLSGLSIPEVSIKTGIAKSTIRFRLSKLDLLRSRSNAVRLAANKGKLGSGMRGMKRVFTQEHKDKISKSRSGIGSGKSKKPNGYIEITMGENKGRGEHVVIMENKIGRKLFANECVHHKNHDRSDNRIENLELMTRAEHASLHAKENIIGRKRNNKGMLI